MKYVLITTFVVQQIKAETLSSRYVGILDRGGLWEVAERTMNSNITSRLCSRLLLALSGILVFRRKFYWCRVEGFPYTRLADYMSSPSVRLPCRYSQFYHQIRQQDTRVGYMKISILLLNDCIYCVSFAAFPVVLFKQLT